MSVLSVRGLCKEYPAFVLREVSFTLEKGRIMGFIGRNGAGKTTTLRALFDFVHPDAGEVRFFDLPFAENQLAIKQRVGFVSGAVDYYPKNKLRTITSVTRRFYAGWQEETYRQYLSLFKLDENKTPSQLSAGMKVKYALALALSHGAQLLVLDEPTSGLDPVSRDELVEVFLDLADKGVSILFSTHITSDLQQCADDILYIQNGRIYAQGEIKAFQNEYRLVQFADEKPPQQAAGVLIGCKRSKEGCTALVRAEDTAAHGLCAVPADLDAIMVHLEKEAEA